MSNDTRANMTNKEKQLLTQDLSSRLLYGVKLKPVGLEDTIISYATLKGIYKDDNGDYHIEINDRDIDGNKLSYCTFNLSRSVISYLPYLRPLSSMTIEERQEYGLVLCGELSINQFDWLNEHHFDFRGLIEKGLALEAPEGIYNV